MLLGDGDTGEIGGSDDVDDRLELPVLVFNWPSDEPLDLDDAEHDDATVVSVRSVDSDIMDISFHEGGGRRGTLPGWRGDRLSFSSSSWELDRVERQLLLLPQLFNLDRR